MNEYKKPAYNKSYWDKDKKGYPRFISIQYCDEPECRCKRQFLSCGYQKYACTYCGVMYRIEDDRFIPLNRKTRDKGYNWSGREWRY